MPVTLRTDKTFASRDGVKLHADDTATRTGVAVAVFQDSS